MSIHKSNLGLNFGCFMIEFFKDTFFGNLTKHYLQNIKVFFVVKDANKTRHL